MDKDEQFYFRKATADDCDLIFNWANDEMTRANSFCTDKISYDTHKSWYKNLLESDERFQYIFMKNSMPIGQVRIDISGHTAEIGYSIDRKMRGLGYGKLIISQAIDMISQDYPGIVEIIAKVKPTNEASITCFTKNGFESQFYQYRYAIIKNDDNGCD